jgi:hypothetical protein
MSQSSPEPYRIELSDEMLRDLGERLSRTRRRPGKTLYELTPFQRDHLIEFESAMISRLACSAQKQYCVATGAWYQGRIWVNFCRS